MIECNIKLISMLLLTLEFLQKSKSVNYNQIDKEKENLADYLFNNPGELLKYNVINIKVLDLEVE